MIAWTISTAAVAATAVALVAPAQAQLTQRIDDGGLSSGMPVMDDCSLRAPCSAVATSNAGPAAKVPQGDRPVVDDCSLRAPCSAIAGASVEQASEGKGATAGRGLNVEGAPRRVQVWSYTADGTLVLHIDGVLDRRPAPPL